MDKLGFKPEDQCLPKRLQFVKDLQSFTQNPERTYLRSSMNKSAFDTMIAGFVRAHGVTYWGRNGREHLEVVDPLEGFLCPRDGYRLGSRYQ